MISCWPHVCHVQIIHAPQKPKHALQRHHDYPFRKIRATSPPNGTQLYDSATSSGWSYGAGSFAIFPFGVPGGSGGQDYINVNSTGEVTASGQCSATSGPNSGGESGISGNDDETSNELDP